jgi:hypothetical protein
MLRAMGTLRFIFRARVMAVAPIAALLALAALPGAMLKADGPTLGADSQGFSLRTVDLKGVSSNVNNIAFAFDGTYSVVAPFETSDPEHQDPFQGDNHYLVVTELANPSNQFKLDLTSLGSAPQTCYYPTHLIVSSNNRAFVRATSADSATHQPIAEVIAYGTLIIDKSTGAVRFDGSIIPIEIPKFLPSSDPGSMPIGFGVSKAGEFLVFTNGAQVLSVDLPTGNLYTVQPVPNDRYAPLPDPQDPKGGTVDYQTITSLDVGSNNIVKVVINGRTASNDFSTVYFYRLREGIKRSGTLDLLAVPVDSSQLSGSQVAPESMVAASDDGSLGYFATTDGWLWSVALKNSSSLTVTPLKHYASINGQSGYEAGPRDVLIDPGKSLTIVKQGTTVNIRRPSYGRHGGGIRRPSYIKYNETPGFVLATLNANGAITGDQEVHDQGFGNGVYAISNPVFTGNGAYLTVSFGDSQGALKLLQNSAAGFTDFGAVPSNVGQIASADGSNIVGIQDFEVASQSSGPDLIVKGGSLVFMSMRQASDALVTAGSYRASIRRPCNVNH